MFWVISSVVSSWLFFTSIELLKNYYIINSQNLHLIFFHCYLPLLLFYECPLSLEYFIHACLNIFFRFLNWLFSWALMLLFICWFLTMVVEFFICFVILVEYYFVWIYSPTLVSLLPRQAWCFLSPLGIWPWVNLASSSGLSACMDAAFPNPRSIPKCLCFLLPPKAHGFGHSLRWLGRDISASVTGKD